MPSPPHANSLAPATFRNISMAGCGPPSMMSKTWRGLSSHWNFCISLAPWLPPDLGLMKTSTGLMLEGIGFRTKGRLGADGERGAVALTAAAASATTEREEGAASVLIPARVRRWRWADVMLRLAPTSSLFCVRRAPCVGEIGNFLKLVPKLG